MNDPAILPRPAETNTASSASSASSYDDIPCGILSIARDGLIVDVNPTFLKWTGYARDVLVDRKRFSELLTAPGKIFYGTQFAPLLQLQGTVLEVAFDLKCPDRPAMPILVNAVVHKNDAGQVRIIRMAVFDATQRRRYERDLLQARKNAERMAAVIACSGDAVFSLDIQGLIETWNAGAERLFGTPTRSALGKPLAGVVRLGHPERLNAVMDRVRSGVATEAIELEFVEPTGRRTNVAMTTISVIRDAMDQVTGLSAIARDVTDRREAQQRLLHASLHDALTGLPNRVLFADRVARCIERCRREPAFSFAVLFLDLDRFKVINDSMGHNAGDELLVGVAKQLLRCVEASPLATPSVTAFGSVVARMGGDEFTLLLEDLPAPDEALRLAERIGEALNRTQVISGRDVFVSASIGVAFSSAGYKTAEEVLRDADAALYRAKANGKGSYAVFDAEMHKTVVAHLALENNLRRALEQSQLLLHYQPLISLSDMTLHGFEALIRWQCNGRLVSPIEFIPVAEDMGLIIPIGQWVIEESCRQLAEWRAKYPAAAGLTMAVNISRKQLSDPELVSTLSGALSRHALPPGCVKVEITESVVMEGAESSVLDVLTRIKDTGVMLAIDDFGTGYSSLSCLHKFPIDVLKLDRSFVADLHHESNAATVVAGVVALAHKLGLIVVAEGLEKQDQIAFLQSLHCDIGQGYAFSKPVPAALAEQFVANPPQQQPPRVDAAMSLRGAGLPGPREIPAVPTSEWRAIGA